MLQVTESRSCILSSTIHIFIKLRSLSLLPKAWTKWKKLWAVLLKPSSPFLDEFLQALRLKRILQRVILLSVLAIFSTPNKIFSITFLSSCMIKCFKLSNPKESKRKISILGSISSILHQCVPDFYPPLLSDIIAAWSIDLFK